MQSIGKDNTTSPITLLQTRETKHKHEYQELCTLLEKTYGPLIWTLPHKVGFTEYKINKAHEIAQKRGITSIKYLIGIIKKL